MKTVTGTRVYVSFVLASSVVMFIGVAAYRSLEAFIESGRNLLHAREIEHRLDVITSNLREIEVLEKTYLIIGKKSHLDRYFEAMSQLRLDVSQLQNATIDDNVLKAALGDLKKTLDAQERLFQSEIRLREAHGLTSAIQIMLTGREHEIRDQTHAISESLKKIQGQRLERENRAIRLHSKHALRVIFNATAVILFLFFAAGLNIWWDLRIKQRQELELIAARKKAIDASNAKSEFLASMSHEIRTPMNAVVGMSDMLLSTKLDEKQLEFTRTIKSSSRALLTVINDILDFSKIEAGKLELEETCFILEELIQGVIATFSVLVADKGLKLAFNISPDTPRGICGDPVRIRQILINLVGNAVKFTSKGGVTIFIDKIDEREERCRLRFGVKDTGVGIPPEAKEKMFQMFSQADSSTTRKFGGTGLGLAISKRLVEIMKGQIGFESVANEGTTFWFEVELKQAKPVETVPEAPKFQLAPEIRAQKRLLVAEDHPVNQRVIELILGKFGYKAEIVANGSEVITALRRSKYDVVLMDCHMPELDGYQTTQLIRKGEVEECTKIPIIALTANATKDEVQRCYDSGMDAHLSKPIEEEKLTAMVDRWLVNGEDVVPSDPKEGEQAVPADLAEWNVIDVNTLKKLRELGDKNKDPKFLTSLVNLFLTDTPSRLDLIEDAVMRENAGALSEHSHALKSAAASLGVSALSKTCQGLEAFCRTTDALTHHDFSEARSAVSHLKSQFEQAQSELRKWLDRLS